VLDMLSGRYPSDQFAELRPRVTWDRVAGTVQARDGAKRVAIANGGTIPDRGLYGVFMAGAPRSPNGARRVGELDEEMVFESRVGETFVLGASSWRIEEITHDRVLVSPAPGEPGKMPFWKGAKPERPIELGRAIGAFTRELRSGGRDEALARLSEQVGLETSAMLGLGQIARVRGQSQVAAPLLDEAAKRFDVLLARSRNQLANVFLQFCFILTCHLRAPSRCHRRAFLSSTVTAMSLSGEVGYIGR
jgi:ATP-dependent Lhr-like helicase